MKHKFQAVINLLFMVIFALSLNITCFAKSDIDFDTYTEGFSPNGLNTFSLEVGESHTPTAAIWLSYEGAYAASSDTSVVTVSETGDVTAKGEGSAYVVFVGSANMNEVYRYDVTVPNVATQSVKETNDNNSELDKSSGLFDKSPIKLMIIPFAVFAVFFVITFSVSVSSVRKVSQIKNTLSQLSINPCQQTAVDFVKALKVNAMQRHMIANSHEYKGGIPKRDCVDVYNNIVIPCVEIDDDTKKEMQARMANIGCVFTKTYN